MSGELIVEKIKPDNLEETILLQGNVIIQGNLSAENSLWSENPVILCNSKVIGADIVLPEETNALSIGPIDIADGVTVDVPTSVEWQIL